MIERNLEQPIETILRVGFDNRSWITAFFRRHDQLVGFNTKRFP
jgi:hypothetical protein